MTIYTIGHSNHEWRDFLALLHRYGIEMLVDVRSAPYSRYSPQFNRESLAPSLEAKSIGYAFAGEYLGGRPRDPDCYRNGVVPVGHADYLKLVDYPAVATKSWYQRSVDRLLELSDEQRAVIMCSEEDPNQCHRHHLIAQTLIERGIEVRHIRKSGEFEEALPLEPEVTQTQMPFFGGNE